MRNHHARPSRSPLPDVFEAEVAPFMAELKTAGYSPSVLHTKRRELRRFLRWRRQRRAPGREPDESEVALYLRRVCPLAPKHRSLAAAALPAFLRHLRRRGLIRTARKAPQAPGSALQDVYAHFLRNEKGLAEHSLLAYLPLVPDLLRYLGRKHGTTSVRRLNADILRAFLFERVRDRSCAYVRLLSASLRSFLRFLHVRGRIGQDLSAAIPSVRRWTQPEIPKVLTPAEVARVLVAPDQTCGTGRRDYAILILLAKGRKARCTPLRSEVTKELARWLANQPPDPTTPVFPTASGEAMSADALQRLVARHVRIASEQCSSLRQKRVTPHTLRHTTAMDLLRNGVDIAVIALWLGHESIVSTQSYLHADMALKEKALSQANQGGVPVKRYRPPDQLLAFLESL